MPACDLKAGNHASIMIHLETTIRREAFAIVSGVHFSFWPFMTPQSAMPITASHCDSEIIVQELSTSLVEEWSIDNAEDRVRVVADADHHAHIFE